MLISDDIKNKPGIYLLINSNNDKVYIGSSNKVRNRLNRHRSELRGNKHRNKYLQNAYNKYKEADFIIKVFYTLEYRLIEKFLLDTFYHTSYNLTEDVEMSTDWFTDELRQKVSNHMKKRMNNLLPLEKLLFYQNNSDRQKQQIYYVLQHKDGRIETQLQYQWIKILGVRPSIFYTKLKRKNGGYGYRKSIKGWSILACRLSDNNALDSSSKYSF